jgi:hypothetical protein
VGISKRGKRGEEGTYIGVALLVPTLNQMEHSLSFLHIPLGGKVIKSVDSGVTLAEEMALF